MGTPRRPLLAAILALALLLRLAHLWAVQDQPFVGRAGDGQPGVRPLGAADRGRRLAGLAGLLPGAALPLSAGGGLYDPGAPPGARLPAPDPPGGRRLLGPLPRRPRDGRRADGARRRRCSRRSTARSSSTTCSSSRSRWPSRRPASCSGRWRRRGRGPASGDGSAPARSSASWRCCARTRCSSSRSSCRSPGDGRIAGRGSRRPAVARWLAGLALALLPVALRNGIVGGDFLPTTLPGRASTSTSATTREPTAPTSRSSPASRSRSSSGRSRRASPSRPLGRRLSAGEVSSYWLGQALDWAREHPGDFLRLQLRKLGMFWSWYEWPDAVDYYYVKTVSPPLRLPLLEFGGAAILALAGLCPRPPPPRPPSRPPCSSRSAGWPRR